ncbi:MAG: hypothetical protein LBP21_03130 [Synergistaceae bacterium]|jgi:hypothetical protein|nr:hypothetical protein [Synergistaceae bacterium]
MQVSLTKEFCREMNLKVPDSAFSWEAKEAYAEMDLPESVINKLRKDYEKKTGKAAKIKIL